MRMGVHASDHLRERRRVIADHLLRPALHLAIAGHALVGADLEQDQLGLVAVLMRGPARLLELHGQRMGQDFGDLHGDGSWKRQCGWAAIQCENPPACNPRGFLLPGVVRVRE
jgi:hypothetical protein